MPSPATPVRVIDEVWIATATLHRQFPDQIAFRVRDIVDRVFDLGLSDGLRASVRVAAYQNVVGNRVPESIRVRYLYATFDQTRRLWVPGDAYHPHRSGTRFHPRRQDQPETHHALVDWYLAEFVPSRRRDVVEFQLAP